jgi:PGF-CTERM protein
MALYVWDTPTPLPSPTPIPPGTQTRLPGFTVLLALASILVAALAIRKKDR